jgi:LTXXQ motif family protein
MLKIVAAGITALLVMASPHAYAQATSNGERSSTANLSALTDMRIDIVKAALQLTPDQEKYWSAIENAIRDRARDRQARIADVAERVAERRDSNVGEALRNRDPVDFMRRRADALEQRGADLKKLADAWQPLYQTLKPDQKKRMAFLTLVVLRDISDARGQRPMQFEDDEEEE